MENQYLPVYLDKLRTVTEDYAVEHMAELLKKVHRDIEAVLIRNEENMAVMVPYSWYLCNFYNDVQKTVEYLFEECQKQNATNAAICLTVADGYLSRASRIVGQEIRACLMDKLDGHPYAEDWQAMLDHWSEEWKKNSAKELWLVMAKFVGDRKIYLLYQNGTTRLLDGRKLIGHGLKAENLKDETEFCNRISITSGALLWMSEEDQIQWAVSSDELLELSDPVNPDKAKAIWEVERVKK